MGFRLANPFRRIVAIRKSGHTLVAGEVIIGGVGTIHGFDTGNGIGSITPTTFNSAPIYALGTFHPNVGASSTFFTLVGTYSQSFLTSIVLNGFTLLGSAAGFGVISGRSIWSWGDNVLTATGTYPATIT